MSELGEVQGGHQPVGRRVATNHPGQGEFGTMTKKMEMLKSVLSRTLRVLERVVRAASKFSPRMATTRFLMKRSSTTTVTPRKGTARTGPREAVSVVERMALPVLHRRHVEDRPWRRARVAEAHNAVVRQLVVRQGVEGLAWPRAHTCGNTGGGEYAIARGSSFTYSSPRCSKGVALASTPAAIVGKRHAAPGGQAEVSTDAPHECKY